MIGEEKVAGKPALPSCHWSVASLSVKLLASATRSQTQIGLDCPPRPLGSSALIGWREEAGIRAPRLLHWWAGKGGWAQRLVGGGPGLGRRGADWSESRLVVRHLGKAESRSGTEVPVYPRRTCRRRHRGIRVRVRARALAASHGECRHSCGQRSSRGVPSGVASSRAGAPAPARGAARPPGALPDVPAAGLKGPVRLPAPTRPREAAPLKGAAPAHPHLPCLGCAAGGGGLGGLRERGRWARPPSPCGRLHLAQEGAARSLLKRQQCPAVAMTRARNEPRDASPGASKSLKGWLGRGQNDALQRLPDQPLGTSLSGAGWGQGGRLRRVWAFVPARPFCRSWG